MITYSPFISLRSLSLLLLPIVLVECLYTPTSSKLATKLDVRSLSDPKPNSNSFRLVPSLPKGSADYNVSVPEDLNFNHVVLGVGTQNYTCKVKDDGGSVWTLFGAEAILFDLLPDRAALQQIIDRNSSWDNDTISNAPNSNSHDTKSSCTLQTPLFNYDVLPLTGLHTFVLPGDDMANETLPLPKFEIFSNSNLTGPSEVSIAEQVGAVAAPFGAAFDINWLQLNSIEGNLSTTILRTHTKGGQPPIDDCTNDGDTTQILYEAVYWFYT